jgi:hypothetical protein
MGSQKMSLEFTTKYARPIPEAQLVPPARDSYLQDLKSRAEKGFLPSEEAAKAKLNDQIALLYLIEIFEERGFDPVLELDMTFMKTNQIQKTPKGSAWKLPRLALVDPFEKSPECKLEFDRKNCDTTPKEYGELIATSKIQADVGFWETRFVYRVATFILKDVVFPDDIREKANIAKTCGFNVWLICDAENSWNMDIVSKDPILCAERGGRWFRLGLFLPTSLEEWISAEMTHTPEV